MHLSLRSATLVLCLAALAPSALAQTPQTFTPKTIVQWGQGGDRERGMLTQMGFGQLAQGQFGLSVADLNADNRPEILVLSLGACDNAGCPVVALQSGGQNNVRQIFSQKVAGRLAITNESANGFNAFAAADAGGAIMKDANTGRQLVYLVGGSAQAAAATPAPSAAAPRPPAAATTPAQTAPAPAARASAPAAPPAAPAMSDAAKVRLALVTGEGQPSWKTDGAEYIPTCLYPRCLTQQIVERSGIGTDKATIRGAVTTEDATRWCKLYKDGYRLCAEEEVTNGGSAGGMFGRVANSTAEANCVAGTLRAIDGKPYTYAGTWPAGGPGAGRPKFAGAGAGTRVFEQQGASQMASGQSSLNQLAYEPNSGESLAIQWEILCKGAAAPAR
jgi:hypothetical protein